jgi:hypothetical protein
VIASLQLELINKKLALSDFKNNLHFTAIAG